MRKKTFLAAVLAVALFLTGSTVCRASDGEAVYENRETGYAARIEDEAELLTETEREDLLELMKEITQYGNAAFVTVASNLGSADSYARNYFTSVFGKASGTVFLIDMDNRKIWIHSDGALYRVITKAYANTITDNVYTYATGEDYYGCAEKAFGQMLALLKGQKIAQPMKYISNLLLAAGLALLFNFGLMTYMTRLKRPKQDELLRTVQKKFTCTKPEAVFLHKTKTYSPQSSDSDSGGSSGGGGGGGGSSSGGGGGHSF